MYKKCKYQGKSCQINAISGDMQESTKEFETLRKHLKMLEVYTIKGFKGNQRFQRKSKTVKPICSALFDMFFKVFSISVLLHFWSFPQLLPTIFKYLCSLFQWLLEKIWKESRKIGENQNKLEN